MVHATFSAEYEWDQFCLLFSLTGGFPCCLAELLVGVSALTAIHRRRLAGGNQAWNSLETPGVHHQLPDEGSHWEGAEESPFVFLSHLSRVVMVQLRPVVLQQDGVWRLHVVQGKIAKIN